jgi:Arc/MetJ family transcription regulator
MARTKRVRQRDTKVPKTYRLSPRKVAAAQRILGTPTATETIETALDMVVFRRELMEGTQAMLGAEFTSPDEAN